MGSECVLLGWAGDREWNCGDCQRRGLDDDYFRGVRRE